MKNFCQKDVFHLAQKYGLLNDLEVDQDGMVHAPTGPGLGAKIDFELIKRKSLAVLT